MKQIVIEIDDCRKCPYYGFSEPSNQDEDEYEDMRELICKKANKNIEFKKTGYMTESYGMLHSEEIAPVPDWCPQQLEKVAENMGYTRDTYDPYSEIFPEEQ